MPSIAPPPPRRTQTMRSFVWHPDPGDELSACPDCANWHALFEWDEDAEYVVLREWHEASCPCWTVDD